MLSAPDKALAELAQRELARRSLLQFTSRFHDNYLPGWVHRKICDRLELFSRQVAEGLSPRLIIAMPPRSGKSALASQFFPAWHLGHHPNHEFIVCSYAISLPMAFSRRVRGLLRDPRYSNIFPDTLLDEDNQSADGWRTTRFGGFKPAGRGGPITGFGASILVLDDLLKNYEEACSETIRETSWDWYVSTARTRLAPGGGILSIGTRWHEDDVLGRMETGGEINLAGDVFEVLRFPAIAVDNEEHRKKGEALHPERYPLKELHKLRATMGPEVWEALYQQRPVPREGGFFQLEWFKTYDALPDDLKTFAAFDLAIGQKERNDWTVGIVGGVDRHGNLYILDLIRDRIDAHQIVEAMLDSHVRHGTFLTGIEHGQLSMAIEPTLNAQIVARKLFSFATKPLKPGRRDKEARARTAQGMCRQGRLFLPRSAPWLNDFLAELGSFPAGKHDDQVDAISYLCLMYEEIPAPVEVQADETPSWVAKLRHLVTGLTQSHMAA